MDTYSRLDAEERHARRIQDSPSISAGLFFRSHYSYGIVAHSRGMLCVPSTTGQQSLQRSTNLLADAQRTVNETEQIGLATVDNMHGQREQLINARATVQDTNTITGEAAKTLNNMARRAAHNRMFLWAIIILLLFFIGLMIYEIFK